MFGIISLCIIIKELVNVDQSLHITYKEDGTTGTSSLNRHLRTCTVKNANTKQACIVYDSYSNSLINASIHPYVLGTLTIVCARQVESIHAE